MNVLPVPIDAPLLDHLSVEFGRQGERSVRFLRTAYSLLTLDPAVMLPSQAEIVAYCLREAMKGLPASQAVAGGGEWRRASRGVVNAWDHFQRAKDLSNDEAQVALGGLSQQIDRLERLHSQENIHERRLNAVMRKRTGVLPLSSGTAPITKYQALLRDLDNALHGDSSMDRAVELWNRSRAILEQLFVAPELRRRELDKLARIKTPSPQDSELLLSLVATPNHVHYFLSRVESPEWLEVLADTAVLDPPTGDAPWPVYAAVRRLAPAHGEALAGWLQDFYERDPGDSERAWFAGQAASQVGSVASGLVQEILAKHGSIRDFARLGTVAISRLDPYEQSIEALADHLLNERMWNGAYDARIVIRQLIGGTDESNCTGRFRLLLMKLKSAASNDEMSLPMLRYNSAGSIAKWSADGPESNDLSLGPFDGSHFTVSLEATVEMIRIVRQWLPTEEVLAEIDLLPNELRTRLRAWTLSEASDLSTNRLVSEVADTIAERGPTGDDLLILDRIFDTADSKDYVGRWNAALGPAPSVADIAPLLASRQLPEEWLRSHMWTGVLPQEVLGGWKQAADAIATAHVPQTREALENPIRGEALWGQSPILAEELQRLSLTEAIRAVAEWRPEGPRGFQSARCLAQTLEGVVTQHPGRWIESPLKVVVSLRHPTYIRHYIRGVTAVIKEEESVPVGELVDVVVLVQKKPWPVEAIGDDDFDYDQDWSDADDAAVEMLEAIAEKHLGFAERSDEVWQMLNARARDRTIPPSVVGGEGGTLSAAINRPCTRAFQVALSFAEQEFRLTGVIRTEALELIEDVLRLEGFDGAQYRAIMATRLHILRQIAPLWVDEVSDLMFGDSAPPSLAQAMADAALEWGPPCRWLLEQYAPLVRDAVDRGVSQALNRVIIAMLCNMPGYSVQENFASLCQKEQRVRDASRMLSRHLQHEGADPSHIDAALRFWDEAIANKNTSLLDGFGWFSEIKALDSAAWANRTLKTLELTDGCIEWSHRVAERAISMGPSTTTLAILNSLIRCTSDASDRVQVLARAAELIGQAEQFAETGEYQRLHTTLLERDAL